MHATLCGKTMKTSNFLSLLLLLLLSSFAKASLTILAMSEAAKLVPSVNITRLHIIPLHLPLPSLTSLPLGAKITTLLHGHSLTLTAPFTLDKVTVEGAPLYDSGNNGSLLIYGIHKYIPRPNIVMNRAHVSEYGDAGPVVTSKGWPIMGYFLKHRDDGIPITIFAPPYSLHQNRVDRLDILYSAEDRDMRGSLLLRHVVPCRLSPSDLAGLDDGSALRTLREGFTIIVSRNGSLTKVNGVPVLMPEIYQNDLVVFYAIGEVLEPPERTPSNVVC